MEIEYGWSDGPYNGTRTYTVKVLDQGYVRLVDTMGSDLGPVNDAKISFDKESKEVGERERALLRFLATEGHTSPFRHSILKFEVYAPLMVARQWWKYCVGAAQDPMLAWNETSRRYITEHNIFHFPELWREAPENKKQGSGGPLDDDISEKLTLAYTKLVNEGQRWYEKALEWGAAPEQARLFLLSNGLYVRWRWTGSLQGVCHFLDQRLAHDAQWEIQQYAQAVELLAKHEFPESIRVWGAANGW